eukprot:3703908-Rhodomonas_salina.2
MAPRATRALSRRPQCLRRHQRVSTPLHVPRVVTLGARSGTNKCSHLSKCVDPMPAGPHARSGNNECLRRSSCFNPMMLDPAPTLVLRATSASSRRP